MLPCVTYAIYSFHILCQFFIILNYVIEDVCGSGTCGKVGCGFSSAPGPCDASGTRCCSADSPSLCGFYIEYGSGGTAAGSIMSDTLSIAGQQYDVHFGYVTTETGTWSTSVDGIMGLVR